MRSAFILLGLCGLFLGWNAPNHYPPWPTFHLEVLAALGICCVGLAVLAPWPSAAMRGLPSATDGRPKNRSFMPLTLAVRVWLCVSLLPVLQYLFGQFDFRGDALLGLLYGVGVVLSLYIGQLWAAQQGRGAVLATLWQTIVVGGMVAAGLALWQWVRLPNPGWWAMELIDDRPFASFAQPNHFGLLMVMSIVAATALYEMRVLQTPWVYAATVAFFGWGAIISQSRASALALATIVALWLLTRKRVPTRLRVTNVILGAASWAGLMAARVPIEQGLLIGANDTGVSVDVGPRQWIWLHFWAAITQHAWWGYGFNQGVKALAEVAATVHPSRNAAFAHNFVLDLMTWAGIPLALAMTAALGLWTIRWLRSGPNVMLVSQRHAVFAIWLALAVQSCLEFPYAHAYFLLPAALLAGAISGAEEAPDRTLRASPWMLALACAAAALLALIVVDYLRLEEDFRVGRFARGGISSGSAQTRPQPSWVLDQLAALNASAGIQVSAGMSEGDIGRLKALARRFQMMSTRLAYAKALALNGRLAQANDEITVIRSISAPAQFQPIGRYWQFWLRQNHLDTSTAVSTPAEPGRVPQTTR